MINRRKLLNKLRANGTALSASITSTSALNHMDLDGFRSIWQRPVKGRRSNEGDHR